MAQDLCKRFNVPKDFQQSGTFVAALIPWALSPLYQTHEWRKPFGPNAPADVALGLPMLDADRWDFSLRTNPAYHHALHVLEFPKWLHDFMSLPNRPYCVWWTPSDGTTSEPGLETKLLHTIMEKCRAKNVGHKADVRVVFIHVGSLKTLHKLPALVERRNKRPDLQFFTYGSHETVSPQRWGIHEIFVLGRHCQLLISSDF